MNCSQIIIKGGLTGHIKQIAKNYNDIYLSKQCTCHYSLKILSIVSSLKKKYKALILTVKLMKHTHTKKKTDIFFQTFCT